MTPETVVSIGQQALWVTMMIAGPLLGSALAVGLLVGMFQAATQINEMTLSFIPKLLVLVLGHTLNLTLGIISGVVHGLRLNLIEFYKWSVFEEGSAFRAFRKKEK